MSDRSVSSAVQKLAGTFDSDPLHMYVCTVVSYDENAGTCVVKTQNGKSSFEIPNVRLQAAVCDGLLILPTVNSNVLVITSVKNPPYVALYSDIDKLYLQVGDSSITFYDKVQSNDSIINLNDGSFGGLVKIQELTNHINTIEEDLNTLKRAFSAWIVSPQDGGAALKEATADWFGTEITPSKVEDYENKLITHGKV
jgi:hypothetical protein